MNRKKTYLILNIFLLTALLAGNTSKPGHLGLQQERNQGSALVRKIPLAPSYPVSNLNVPMITPNIDQNILYLPLINSSRGIYGRVTWEGDPLPDIRLQLRFFDGESWSTIATRSTDVNGDYSFIGIPALNTGQLYYVLYQNSIYLQWLWIWQTRELANYEAGSDVNIGNFDLDEVHLDTPEDLRKLSIPIIFSWWQREATPTDSYAVHIYDPYFDVPSFSTDLLGYSYLYTLNFLPAGFRLNYWYAWEIWIYSPDGGFGISYDLHALQFTPGLLNMLPREQVSPTGSVPSPAEKITR